MKTKKSNFTLIEMLVALAVFMIISVIVFQMLASSQKIWSMTESNTRIYENARIALDLITRDLQSAVVSNREGAEIPFWAGSIDAPPSTPTGKDLLAFVSAVNPIGGGGSRLNEIIYHHNTTNYQLKHSSADSDTANWNFFGQTSGTVWFNDSANRRTVIRGVDDMYFVCYDSNGDEIVDTDGDGDLDSPVADSDTTVVPAAVFVSITLFDPDLTDVWAALPDAKKNQSRRTFTKMIYLKIGALGN